MESQVSGKLTTAADAQPYFDGCRSRHSIDRKLPPLSTRSTSRPTGIKLVEGGTLMPVEADLYIAPELVAEASAGPTAGASITFPVEALSNTAGNFTLVFPDQREIASKTVKLVVSSPKGGMIREMELEAADLPGSITIQVQEFATTLDKPDEPTKPKTRRIRGRLIWVAIATAQASSK